MRGLAREAYREEIRDMEQPIQQRSYPRNRHSRGDNRPQIRRENRFPCNDKYRPKLSAEILSILSCKPLKSDEKNDTSRSNYIADPSKQGKVLAVYPTDRKKVAVYDMELRVKTEEQMNEQIDEYNRRRPGNQNQKQIRRQNKPRTYNNQIILDDQDEDKQEEIADLSYSDFRKDKKVEKCKEKEDNLSFSLNESDDWGWVSQDKLETEIIKKVALPQKKVQEKKGESSNISQQQLNKGFIDKSNTSNDSSQWLNQKQLINQQQEQDSSSSNNDESFVSSVHSNHQDSRHQNSYSHMDESSSIVNSNKIEQILKVIEQSSQFQQKDIMLNLQVQNTRSLTIKEILLKKLNTNIKLGINFDEIIVKNCEIQIQKLVLYISFFKIDIIYPQIYEQDKIDDKSFMFCRIKVPPINRSESKNQSKFIKKPKKVMQSIQETLFSLLKITKVELRCLNCDKANEVAVIENTQGFNEAGLSCAGCADKIFAKMRFSLQP